MARQPAAVIKQVRYQLQDEDDTNYRYTDERLVETLNMALLDIWRLRPDLFLAAGWTLTEYTTANLTDSTELPISDLYFSTVVKLVVGYVELENDNVQPDGKAATMLGIARAELQGVA